MSDDSDSIECPTHGPSRETYICEHLAQNGRQRWHCAYPTEDNPWPDAWCDLCNAEYLKHGEWNDENNGSIKIKMLCSACYEDRRAESVDIADPAQVRRWDDLVSSCCAELEGKNERLWKRLALSSYGRWDWDQEQKMLIFSDQEGRRILADINFVGSYSSKSDTWLWSWANFSLLEGIRESVIAVRDFGEQQGFPALTVPKWPAKQEDGWHMASIAARLLNAEGVYRTPSDYGYLFMVMRNVRADHR
jgi:hypothetical protein